jgi:carbamoyltransferase
MNILGIGGYSHDSAAALVCDGRLVAAVAEERLTRVKHQGGVPMVINTSFNAMGEPIFCTPVDAVRCFYSTGMDALVIGNCVVVKR